MNDQLAAGQTVARVIWWTQGGYGGGGTGFSIVFGCIACDVSNEDNAGPSDTCSDPCGIREINFLCGDGQTSEHVTSVTMRKVQAGLMIEFYN